MYMHAYKDDMRHTHTKHTHTSEILLGSKKEQNLPLATTKMDLGSIMFSEIHQTEKINTMNSLIHEIF